MRVDPYLFESTIRTLLRKSTDVHVTARLLKNLLDDDKIDGSIHHYWECFECKICGGPIVLMCESMANEDEIKKLSIHCEECVRKEKTQRDEAIVKAYRQLPYPEYLLTPHWQEVRRRALERDGNACRLCGSGDSLNVHHRTYDRLGCEDPNDVVTLCKLCHQLFHDQRKLALAPPPGAPAS